MTWNPVWGCRNHCEYCYARGIAKRFAGVMAEYEVDEIYGGSIDSNSLTAYYEEKKDDIENFKPIFLHSQFDKKFPKKPQRIFIGSMSEIRHWELSWIFDVLQKVEQYPQHIFQFLTKFPQVYLNFSFPKNCWLGITITKNDDFYNGAYNFVFPKGVKSNYSNIRYISFEPLLGRILDLEVLKYFDWIIVGAETGNRKGKIIPKKEWVKNIVDYCRGVGIPIYLKDSLKDIYPEEIKEFPEGGR